MDRLARFLVARFPGFTRAIVVAVWARLTVEDWPDRTPEQVTVFDALRRLGA